MMPFAVRGRFPLDAIVNVRLTADEKDRLKEDADLAGMSVSELVRRRYFGHPIVAHADIVMIRELRRLGGLLKHLYTSSNGEHAQETLATLHALKAAIEAISRDPQKN
ncbi:plasmid mobilization protein [Acetobacter malorum]|nr:ribbon-helix-helix protein, CopG family [Acetobacter malorum]